MTTLYKAQTITAQDGATKRNSNTFWLDKNIKILKHSYNGESILWDNTNAQLYTAITGEGQELKALSMDGIVFWQVINEELNELRREVYMKELYIEPAIRHAIM